MIPLFPISLSILYAVIFGMFTLVIFYSREEIWNAPKTPISIIVAVRNEIKTIEACASALISQSYPGKQRQLIIIDDGSTDGTTEKLAEISENNPGQILFLSTQNSHGNKKLALHKGIEAATGELLLFTDADCIPPRTWAETIVSGFSQDIGLIVGFSPLIHTTNKFLNGIFRIDSLYASLFAAAGINLNFPLTATGRNLAFRRSVYLDAGGYQNIMHSMSGDDDLFMHQVHAQTQWKLRYSFQQQAIVPSRLNMSLREFFHQKQRHISASKYYPRSQQLFYALIHGINFCMYGFLGYSIAFRYHLQIAIVALGAKYLVDYIFLSMGAKQLSSPFQPFHFICWELISLGYNAISGVRAFICPVNWKRSSHVI